METLAAIREEFGEVQRLSRPGAPDDELAFVTGEGPEGELRSKLDVLKKQGAQVLGLIRLCDY